MKKVFFVIILVSLFFIPILFKENQAIGQCTLNEQSDRAGCCSHHGGVCGCNSSYKHLQCCDGTLSPSCGC